MITEVITYFIGIGALGIVWYLLDDITIGFIDKMVAKYPTLYAVDSVLFAKAMIHWFLLFALIGISYSLFVVAQRKKQPSGFYR